MRVHGSPLSGIIPIYDNGVGKRHAAGRQGVSLRITPGSKDGVPLVLPRVNLPQYCWLMPQFEGSQMTGESDKASWFPLPH